MCRPLNEGSHKHANGYGRRVIFVRARCPVPLTRHDFKWTSRVEGCSQKALAPLATLLCRYRGIE